jgi:hypothetical protein
LENKLFSFFHHKANYVIITSIRGSIQYSILVYFWNLLEIPRLWIPITHTPHFFTFVEFMALKVMSGPVDLKVLGQNIYHTFYWKRQSKSRKSTRPNVQLSCIWMWHATFTFLCTVYGTKYYKVDIQGYRVTKLVPEWKLYIAKDCNITRSASIYAALAPRVNWCGPAPALTPTLIHIMTKFVKSQNINIFKILYSL